MKKSRKKVLGQHFIKTGFLKELVPFLDVKGKSVIEIGVGRGSLTKKIAPLVKTLKGYEKDPYLYRIAKKELEPYKNVKIVLGDALGDCPNSFDLVIGNLPFSISSRFIEWLILCNIKRAVVILQKDFVDKLLAKPGDKKYVALSVLARYFYSIKPLLIIPPSWFSPSPKVYPTLIEFIRKRENGEARKLIEAMKKIFSTKKKLAKSVLGKDAPAKRIYELKPEILCELVTRKCR